MCNPSELGYASDLVLSIDLPELTPPNHSQGENLIEDRSSPAR